MSSLYFIRIILFVHKLYRYQEWTFNIKSDTKYVIISRVKTLCQSLSLKFIININNLYVNNIVLSTKGPLKLKTLFVG